MKERDTNIDIIKGIAIFLVVWGHISIADTFLIKAIYIIHMPCFFFISGYLAYSVQNNVISYKKYLITKIKRLLIPFLAWSGIACLFNIFLQSILQKNILSIGDIGKEVWEIFAEARSVWFLIVLFFTFIFWEILHYFENKFFINIHHGGMILYVLGWLLLCITLPDSIFSFYKLKFFFPYFGIGYLLHRHFLLVPLERYKKWLNINAIIFLVLIFLLKDSVSIKLFRSMDLQEFGIMQIGIGILLSFMGILFIFLIALLLNRIPLGNWVKEWGIYSLDIYVIHMFFIKILKDYLEIIKADYILYTCIYSPIVTSLIVSIVVFWVKKVGIKIKLYCLITGKD